MWRTGQADSAGAGCGRGGLRPCALLVVVGRKNYGGRNVLLAFFFAIGLVFVFVLDVHADTVRILQFKTYGAHGTQSASTPGEKIF